MLPIVRMYANEQSARAVADDLRGRQILDKFLNREFRPFSPFVLSPSGSEAGNRKVVAEAVSGGILPGALGTACLSGLGRGRTVLVVRSRFGSGGLAEEILAKSATVDDDRMPSVSYDSAAPLSDILGIPMLVSGRNPFPVSRLLGLPMLSRGGTVMGTSAGNGKPVTGSSQLTSSGAPVTAGMMPMLTGSSGPKTTSFGFPLLTKSATPLSSMFGLPLLTGERN